MRIRLGLLAQLPSYMNDVPEIIRAYFPYIILSDDVPDKITISTCIEKDFLELLISSPLAPPFIHRENIAFEDSLEYRRRTKQLVKTHLYLYCNRLTGVSLPYGSLTGVRPTRQFYNLIGKTNQPKDTLIDDFFVFPDRASLIERVVENQKGVYNKDEKGIGIYVNIPFCPTRCDYCTFISVELAKVKKKLPAYILAVKGELRHIKQEISEKGYNVRSIYVGGGTPTSLTGEQLYEMMGELKDFGCEFTVEAGRPDSIDKEKLDALADLNVTRVSINPQTFNESVLWKMGRNHSEKDIYTAFSLARKYPFDINMDLIAGLSGDDFFSFKDSINKAIDLDPENITIHTLSIKRGAKIQVLGAEKATSGMVKEMADYSISRLLDVGYHPYYMYRQKNTADNLENVGYAKAQKICIYNIDFMEETNTILSAGAGGVTKYVDHSLNQISRKSNPKDINQYLERIQDK